jgi:hypothetical protein
MDVDMVMREGWKFPESHKHVALNTHIKATGMKAWKSRYKIASRFDIKRIRRFKKV